MGLVSELRRRNVIRVAIAYAVVAWLLIEITATTFPILKLPDWSVTLVTVFVLIGFPLALIFVWAYELTPEGLKKEKDVDRSESITHITGRKLDYLIIAVLVLALGYFSFDKFVLDPSRDAELVQTTTEAVTEQAAETADKSIAVLAFTDLSPEGDQEYFSDGISEEILNVLAQFPDLHVTSRSSAFSFKDKGVDIPTVAKQLGVANILEGSVRKSGKRIRITAQLIDAKTDTHLWSQIYDRELTASNLFHIQTEIARAIAGQMAITLMQEEEQQLAAVPTENMDAYATYLLGRQRLTDRKVAGLAEAVEQFSNAIELDPEYAAAYAGLHDACVLSETYGGGNIPAQCPSTWEALEALLRKALALDETLGEAWISLGDVLSHGNEISAEQAAEADAAFKRGMELAPSFSQGYLWYAIFLRKRRSGDDGPQYWARLQDSFNVARSGLEVDPLSVPLHYTIANISERRGDFDAALWHAERMVEIAPDSPRGYDRLAELNWSILGQVDQSIKWASKAAQLDRDYYWYPLLIGHAYTSLGDYDRALEYFARAEQLLTASRFERVVIGKALALLSLGRQRDAELLLTEFLEPDGRGLLLDDDGDETRMVLWILAGINLSAGRADVALARYQRFWPECFRDEHPLWVCRFARLQIARVMQELGDHERARQWVQESWEEFQADIVGRQVPRLGIYGVGISDVMYLAMQGQRDEALDALEEAVNIGWRGFTATSDCPPWDFNAQFNMTLDAIRDDPRFQAAFAIIEADMAMQLESVREMERTGAISVPHEIAD